MTSPGNCPCVRAERPVAPCAGATCFHFSLKARRGRPVSAEVRDVTVAVAVSARERALIQAAAKRASVSMSEFARRAALAAAEEAVPK